MVDRFNSYFPGRIIGQPQDDDGSTVYVSTDNGWTNDEQSVAGNPDLPTSAAPVTDSDFPSLIDFDSSDNRDIPPSNDLTENITIAMNQHSDRPGTDGTDDVLSLNPGPHAHSRTESNRNPLSAESTSTGS
ncbi:hypothetical protein LY76DRAFT_674831 [Colletotrichum caudatum]|nr:hypothetical protein LY76DRAFT_674831 [Colletotrichum caudatum]